MLQPAWLGTPRAWPRWASGGRGLCEFMQFPHKIVYVVPSTQVRYPPPTAPPIPVWYLQRHRLQAQSLSANQSGCFRKRCFSTSKTIQEPKCCLSLPLLSDSFFAPGTPKPLKVLLRGGWEGSTGSCPTLTGSWRGGVTGGVKSQSKSASSFLTFAPNSRRQPSSSLSIT